MVHKHQRSHPHYTPSHASWLNQAELFFSILTRRLLRRGEFASVTELVDRIMAFIAEYNHTARPFRWTYDGRPLQGRLSMSAELMQAACACRQHHLTMS